MSDARDICFEHVASCDSTQQMAAERVGALGPHQLHVVLADAQRAGRGREGRVWEDPPGAALLLSIAARGPWPCSTLDDLPRRVAQLVATTLADELEFPHGQLAWKAPNDLVAARASAHAGAKVGGILIDARSTSNSVTDLIIGIGVNLSGGAFRTSDGRRAVAVDALQTGSASIATDTPRLARTIAAALQQLLLRGV